ncbi:MAG: hypothetical protein IJ436_08060 [Bacteroidaceae bacterium]|nr:hypothetical protein [Bacteroidaceae bacterium]
MKKIFSNLLLIVLSVVAFSACDNGEESLEYEGYFLNVYDVKEGGNSYYLSFAPAFADTVYSIKKTEALGLSAGDRAYMVMKYYFDAYAMDRPHTTAAEVITKISRRSMSAKGSFDVALYNHPFSSVELLTFSDMSGEFAFNNFLWADGETQNIAVKYNKDLNCTPKMTVDSLRNGVLYFRLYANLENRGWVDNETYSYENIPGKVCKVLSFNMDWDMIFNELSTPEKDEIVAIDSLRSCISLVVDGCKKGTDGLYIPNKALTDSKFANGLYKRK